jgi:hypothetical protein
LLGERKMFYIIGTRGRIFSHVRPFYERVVSNLDRPMHRSQWVLVAHSSFIEGSHATKNTSSGVYVINIFPLTEKEAE